MRKVIFGVVGGVVLTIAVIAAGLYYVYEKGTALQAEKEAKIEQERQGAVSQFGTTCENATAKIAAYVSNELKSGLSTQLAEGQGKDDLYSSLVTSLKKHAGYASYCGRNARYSNGDRDFESAGKLVKLNSGLSDIHTFLTASKHENCDINCRYLLLNSAIKELPKLEQVLVADRQW